MTVTTMPDRFPFRAGLAANAGMICMILAMLLRRLRFATVEGKVPRPVAHLTVRAAEGIHLEISRR